MMEPVQPGTILLGKYRVEQVLGQGGMGYVVAARHEELGELFAIKLMLPEVVEDRDAVTRFLNEARACAKLKGEHVARVHDVGRLENGAPYMVIEYLDGDDLDGVLRARQFFPYNEAALYVLQACEAVAEAHAAGIVHRDLKPSNLFLTRRPNGTPCVKVLDFGISKQLDHSPSKAPSVTATGNFVGSPLYMSPERLDNATDPRSDIWALGVILYEFATGYMPFPGETVVEILKKVLNAHPVPPSHLRKGIPPEFEEIVLRCLEKQPEHRYPSVRELMTALQPLATASVVPVVSSVEHSNIRQSSEAVDDTITVSASSRNEALEAPVPAAPVVLDSKAGEQVLGDGANEAPKRIIMPSDGRPRSSPWANYRAKSTRKRSRLLIVAAMVAMTIALIGGGFFVMDPWIWTRIWTRLVNGESVELDPSSGPATAQSNQRASHAPSAPMASTSASTIAAPRSRAKHAPASVGSSSPATSAGASASAASVSASAAVASPPSASPPASGAIPAPPSASPPPSAAAPAAPAKSAKPATGG